MNDLLQDTPRVVKLFVGMLSRDISLFDELKKRIHTYFGPVDLESPVWEWNHTDYYAKEMGTGLKRKFIFLKELISPDAIAAIKLNTIELEKQYLHPSITPTIPPFATLKEAGEGYMNGEIEGGPKTGKAGFAGGRRINLDPGYIDSAKVVLVSTKDFSHRIYLGKGIYGEVTLMYSGKDYQVLPYTYHDFRTREYRDIFITARRMFRSDVLSRS